MEFKAKYCDITLSFACFSQVFFSILPTVCLIPLAQKSYMSMKHRLHTQKGLFISNIHFYKALLTCLLIILPIAKIAEQIFKEETLNAGLNSIFSLIAALNWIVILFLLRREYKTIGYTSIYLRLFWIVDLCCSILLHLSDFRLTLKLTNEEFLDMCYLCCLVFLNVYGWTHIRDSPSFEASTEMVDDYFRLIDIEKGPNRQYQLQEKLLFKADMPTTLQIQDPELQSSYAPKDFAQQNLKSPASQSQVFDISVVAWENVVRNDKNTTLYTVIYQLDGDRKCAKRSYSEFFRLFKKTTTKFPTCNFPQFPEKKNTEESSQRSVILDRKETFDKLLKLICHKKLYTRHFFEFIKSTEEVPYFGYTSSRKENDSPQNSNLTTRIVTKNLVGTNEEKTQEHLLVSPIKRNVFEWEGIQFEIDSETFGDRNLYTIDIVTGAYRGNNIHYGINVSHKKSLLSFERTYTDFEELHQKMEELNQESIPDFPGRGRLGILTLKNDEGLLDFSRIALKEYLKLISSQRKVYDCPAFRDFFKIDNCF